MRVSPARDADELIFESRNEGVRTDQHDRVVAGAAFERLAVDGAGKRDRDPVVLCRLFAFAARGVRLVLVGDAGDAFLDLGITDLGGEFGELDALEIAERDRRHNFKRHRVVEVAFAGDQLLDRAFVGRQRNLRIGGELEAALGDDLIVGVAHGCFDHLRHGRAAIHALEVSHRHFAGAEAVDADAALQIVQTLVDFGVEFGGRHDHLEFALETVRQCFSNLHWITTRCLHSRDACQT